MRKPFIPPHGGYENLLSFQRAQIIYDATVKFCAEFFGRRDRTVDSDGAGRTFRKAEHR